MAKDKRAFDDWMNLYTCDDPYWRIPTRYMDPSRVEGAIKKVEKLDKRYPGCADDLFGGVPTYYCVLCISKSDSPQVIKEAYERKKNFSAYPDVVIERAYDMLSDDEKRTAYDGLMRLFQKLLLGFHAIERRELKEEHEDWLQEENKAAIWGYILTNRRAWLILSHRGAPTFYELIGVDRAELKEGEELKCKNTDVDARLADEICGILNNPQLRFEYDFMLDERTRMQNDDEEKDFDDLEDDVTFREGGDVKYLLLLKYYTFLERYEDIMNEHGDWENYTGEKTFYDVLGIDAALIPVEKREAENFIRNAYRGKERTPEVNLAYTAVKNSRLREDYNWLLKHWKWISMLRKSDRGVVDDAEIIAAMEMADAQMHSTRKVKEVDGDKNHTITQENKLSTQINAD